ncbi:hypothetical protein E3U55_11575 [Filobacillus milosensis]|uniref:Uncharacterized protein n=1 Tax=Filobacillus milosensis TaxID=94137 RepID=A0A4Y8IFC5_9BACI|nr:hypothetical protein [Filobacillus milosensis]TFB18905.1 hypothetical protein E3U55_11575 [Filobacillus milosensis]
MKKLNRWILGLFIVIIGLASYLVVEANGSSGQFISMSHSGVQHDLFEEHEEIYLGKWLKWTGEDSPVIKNVNIYTDDGQLLTENHPEIRINTYVDESLTTGVIYNKADHMQLISKYKKAENYQLKSNDIMLVFEIDLLNPTYQFNLDQFEIEFELNGRLKKQQLIMKNFIFHQ